MSMADDGETPIGSRRGSLEAQEVLADSAKLVAGRISAFKEDRRGSRDSDEQARGQKDVVKGVTAAFKSKRTVNGELERAGYNEKLGVSNLGVDALSNVNAPGRHIENMGSDARGIAEEALGDKAGKSSRSGRRKSISEAAPKISKMRKSALKEALADLMPVGSDDAPKNAKIVGDRCLVKVGEEERPIRMDTREGHAPKLNGLVQEIKRTRLHSHNREFNRVEKVRSLNKEISRLSYQRAEYSLEASGWTSESWRWVNANRTRRNPEEMLQDCAPAKRLGALRTIEKQCMAAVAKGTRPPSPTRRPPTIRAWV
jgi:hypothetical protein